MTKPLSQSAQAVLDAAEPYVCPSECPGLEDAIAAALRIAATRIQEPEDLLDIAAELAGWANVIPTPETKQ